jgi:S-adenosylmethionine decarboxylase proenzyme
MTLGKHLIFEVKDFPKYTIDEVELKLLDLCKKHNLTVVSTSFNQFYPYGISGVIIIAESHITIHTWDEYNFASVDVFVCDLKTDLTAFMKDFEKEFGGKVIFSKEFSRGF